MGDRRKCATSGSTELPANEGRSGLQLVGYGDGDETEGIVKVHRREKKNGLLDSQPEWQLGSQEEIVARYRRLTVLAF